MSYVPNSAMHHAVAEPDAPDETEQPDRAGSRWWKVAGSIGLGLAIAAPGVVGLLRTRNGRKSRRPAGSASGAGKTAKSSPRAAAKPRARAAAKPSPAADKASPRGKAKRPRSAKAAKATKPA